MATRSNIVIKSGKKKTYLYHHWDGYPEGVGEDLKNYLQNRNKEMNGEEITKELLDGIEGKLGDEKDEGKDKAYKKTDGIHGDVEYIYTIDTDKGTLSYKGWNWETDKWDKPVKMYQGKPSSSDVATPAPQVRTAPGSSSSRTSQSAKASGGKG